MGRKTLYGNTSDQQEIDLFELLIFYMGRLPLLIAAAVCGALLSGLITHFCIADKYTAVSRMYMVSASSSSVIDLADLNIGTSLSNDYVELMKTRPVVEEVIDSLGLDYKYNDLVGMISLSVVPNTRIVKISVTSTDPQEAMDIANEMARVSRAHLPQVMSAPAPTIAEEAILPKNRSYPSMSRNVASGTMAALFAVLGVLTVIYLMDDTIRTAEDFEKEFGIMPMTVIPEGRIEGLAKRDDSDTATRFRIPGLPMRKRRKEEYISSWTHTGSARIAEKQAVPAREPAPLPMRQSESKAGALPYPAAGPVEHAEPAGFAAGPVEHAEPAAGLVEHAEPAAGLVEHAEPAAGSGHGSPAVEVVSSSDPAFAAAKAVSSEESASGPAAAAAAPPAEPAWEIRRVPGTGRSGPPVLELRPAGRNFDQSASRQRSAYEARHSGSRPTYYYNSNLSASRRYRKRRQQMKDLAIGTACLAGAVFLSGLLISQVLFAPAPVPVSETASQDAPAADRNALPQGTGAAGVGSNYARVLVYLDSMQRVIEERYVAQDGTVVMNEKGYAILRNQYDANGNLTRTSYYDDNNNPVFVRELGYSSISITYDQFGNKTGEIYYDTDGSPLTGQ